MIDITSTTNKPFDVNERLIYPDSIVGTLSGLVSMTQATSTAEKDTIRLAHFSVEEYLVSERIMGSPASMFSLCYTSSARRLSSGCLYYLQCPDIPGGPASTVRELYGWEQSSSADEHCYRQYPNLSDTFPFFVYAARYWHAHVKDCEGSTPGWLLDVMWSFFGSQESFRFWEDVHRRSIDFKANMEAPKIYSTTYGLTSASFPCVGAFCYACRYGLVDVVQRFLDIDARSDGAAMCGSEKVTGLYADELRTACYFNQEVVFFKLLDAGADHAHVGLAPGTALVAAMHSQSPNERIICRLLELSGRLLPSDPLTRSIMQWAVDMGNLRAVDLLLEKTDGGLDQGFEWTKPINTLNRRLRLPSYHNRCSAPYQAAVRGHFDILQRLIDSWGYVNEADYDGRTSLYWAAFHGHENIVKLLLDNGAWANIFIRDYGWKPIDWAKEMGNMNIVKLLEDRSRDEPGPWCLGAGRSAFNGSAEW